MFTANIAANHVFSTLNMAAQYNLSSVDYGYRHPEKEKEVRRLKIELASSEFSEDDIKNLINDINELLED